MNSPKYITRTRIVSAAAMLAMGFAGLAHAQDPSQQLNFAKALKAVYASQSSSSGGAAAAGDINAMAASSPDCDNLMKAKKQAAENHIKNKIPPDPTKTIQNSTCFIDVMNIQIPMSGIGFLDSVVSFLGPYVQNSACNATAGWWNEMKTKAASGNYVDLVNQGFGAMGGTSGGTFSPINIVANGTSGGLSTGGIALPSGNGSTTIAGAIAGALTGSSGSSGAPASNGTPITSPAESSGGYLNAILELQQKLGL